MRSSIAHVAVEAGMISVRRSSPYLSTISRELVADDLALARLGGEDVLVVGDLGLELGGLVEDLLALERGEAAQLQVEDRVGLDLVDVEQLHQARARLVDVGRAADQRDDLVERVERLEVAA